MAHQMHRRIGWRIRMWSFSASVCAPMIPQHGRESRLPWPMRAEEALAPMARALASAFQFVLGGHGSPGMTVWRECCQPFAHERSAAQL